MEWPLSRGSVASKPKKDMVGDAREREEEEEEEEVKVWLQSQRRRVEQ